MLKNYIKTALRNLWKGRVFNGLNLLGLSVAIACCTLLFLTCYYELSYDNFDKNLPNLYEVYTSSFKADGTVYSTAMPVPLGPALKDDYQEIEGLTREASEGGQVKYGDKQLTKSVHYIDEDYLKMFTYPIVKGDAARPLKNLNDIVITEPTAKAIFGDVDPIGKTLEITLGSQTQSFLVTAVAKDFPSNSSLNFDILMRFENIPGYQENLRHWDNWNHQVFIQLNPNADAKAFGKKMQAFVNKHFSENIKDLKRDGARANADGNVFTMGAFPFSNFHFATNVANADGSPGVSKGAVVSLMVIGIFILVIACINFVNLSVARSFTRAREVGVRKTLGAGKWQLLSQFWVETIMICFGALLAGLFIASITLSGFKAALRSNIKMDMMLQPGVILGILGVFIIITIVAGFYPALIMLRFKTVQVLKGIVNTGKPGRVRNTLLVVQFSISTLLIVCTIITWQQTNYMQSKPLGFNQTEVLSIPTGSGNDGSKELALFRNVMNGEPNIVAMTGAYDNLGRGSDGSQRTSVNGFDYKGHEIHTFIQKVDYDYIKTLDIKLLDGRDFSPAFASDSNSIVINEAMARQLKEKSIVGALLPMDPKNPRRIVGLFKDYNFRSLQEAVTPMSLVLDKAYPINYIFIKVKPGSLVQTFDRIQQKWRATFPAVEFNGTWLNENTQKQYKKEQRLSTIYISSAIIAILISCIGLVAISIMIMVQRTKEIGIRKVLGSSVGNIVMLLSGDFIKLVGLAALISFPIGWWVMHNWLSSYAYQIDIQWWVFALAGVMAVVIAFVTISFQSIRAALANPVKSLRSE